MESIKVNLKTSVCLKRWVIILCEEMGKSSSQLVLAEEMLGYVVNRK